MAMNAPVQGTASDMIKTAMVRIRAALVERGLKARMLLQVHDERLFEPPRPGGPAGGARPRRRLEAGVAARVAVGGGAEGRDLGAQGGARPPGGGRLLVT